MKRSEEKSGDTIVALSTPRGYSGIGVVRMSGPEALSILERIFEPASGKYGFPDRRVVYGKVFDGEKKLVLDDGLALFVRGPSTYTGDDVVELSLHGSPLVLDLVAQAIVRLGARPAQRGEFTRRAFLSGKLDLVQAEAVIDLIEAGSPAAIQEARGRLDRTISKEITEISDRLKDLLAEIEAHIDFDEDEEEPVPEPLPALKHLLGKMNELRANAEAGRMRREGLTMVITGKPNVGKSTLFNALLREDRTIVTPYPGTTRDTVDELLLLDGISFLVCDTAGIRRNPDPVEGEGIRRTIEKIGEADLVIALLDASSPLDDEDARVLEVCRGRDTLLVLNKTDLGLALDLNNGEIASFARTGPALSAKTGMGMDALREMLAGIGKEKAWLESPDRPGSLSRRGLLLMEAALIPLQSLEDTYSRGQDVHPEIVSLELRSALRQLSEITGEDVDEGVLDRIFERFCVGK